MVTPSELLRKLLKEFYRAIQIHFQNVFVSIRNLNKKSQQFLHVVYIISTAESSLIELRNQVEMEF